MLRLSTSIVLLALIATLAACSKRETGTPVDLGTGGGDAGGDAGNDVDGGDAGGHPIIVDGGPGMDTTIVYAHSSNTLYAFDPRTVHVTSIGMFTISDGTTAPSMTDIAVNQAGELYACSRDKLYRVDPMTAVATYIADLGITTGVQFNGLTFVPVGVLDPAFEVLVGATDSGDYYRVDTMTGVATLAGHYSNMWGSSGDLVSVAGAGSGGAAGTFATVKKTGVMTDHLVSLDPVTGVTTDIGDIGISGIFGLGYWRGTLYGFTKLGALVSIDIRTGVGTTVTASTGATQFYGAGVTTLAPTLH